MILGVGRGVNRMLICGDLSLVMPLTEMLQVLVHTACATHGLSDNKTLVVLKPVIAPVTY